MTTVPLIIVGSILSSSVITSLITKWFDRRKSNAETTDLLSQAWERSMKNLTNQLEMQQKRIYDLEKKLEAAYLTISELKKEISEMESYIARRRKDDDAN